MTKCKVLIIGAGAVGLSIAAKISENADVSVVCRKRHSDSIAKNGLLMDGIWGEKTVCNINCITEKNPAKNDDYDFIFLTSKSTDTEKLCDEYKGLMSGKPVVSIQNGIGNEEIISGFTDIVLGATITTNFQATGDGRVNVNSESGSMKIGFFPDDSLINYNANEILDNIIEILTKSGIPVEKSSNIKSAIWEKSLLNIAVNPLTAILSVNTGELLDENLKEIVSEIIYEAFEVIKAEKISVKWNDAEDYLSYLFEYLLPAFYTSYTSMYQDLKLNRMTEIDFINGAIVKRGKDHGIITPYNSFVSGLVRYKQKKS
ncbi:2-dehydropantoate 2-reductase [Methanoplanus sp. FWC-SCC4]|uniref:2-dehydropantoate 2-reductase n=1 Tax=Methanochimaera problematica TaxID=2609417 RepID=A0AA97FB12_9EURY|nr:2-dehydropantoate 2-reductase [Methanoplanus sp. FWC-SCC4]WOF16085.1 2-dehydropantoate 2-reductase [Methanoplanus sp. FWC-SCC4]